MLYISFNFCLNYSKESFGESDSDFKPVSLYTKRLHLKPLRLRYRTTKLASEKRRKNLTPRCFVESNIFFQRTNFKWSLNLFFEPRGDFADCNLFFLEAKKSYETKETQLYKCLSKGKGKKVSLCCSYSLKGSEAKVLYETFLILAFIVGLFC